MPDYLPVGKLPPNLLARLLARAPNLDERVRLRPGVGLDCAVVDLGDRLLVFKSDPITFATESAGCRGGCCWPWPCRKAKRPPNPSAGLQARSTARAGASESASSGATRRSL